MGKGHVFPNRVLLIYLTATQRILPQWFVIFPSSKRSKELSEPISAEHSDPGSSIERRVAATILIFFKLALECQAFTLFSKLYY